MGKTLPPHLVCYADSESILIPNAANIQGILNTHKMISFAYVILNGVTGKVLTYNKIFGNNTSKLVVPTLRRDYQKYHAQFLSDEVGMFLTEEDEFDADTTTHCIHCGVLLTWDLTCNYCKQPVFKTDSNGKKTLIEGNYLATILTLFYSTKTVNQVLYN